MQYIKCILNEGCKTLTVEANSCNANGVKIGDLIVDSQDNSKIRICIDDSDDNAIELSAGNTSKRPFISINESSGAGVFGKREEERYVLLKIESDDGGVHCFRDGKFYINIYLYL